VAAAGQSAAEIPLEEPCTRATAMSSATNFSAPRVFVLGQLRSTGFEAEVTAQGHAGAAAADLPELPRAHVAMFSDLHWNDEVIHAATPFSVTGIALAVRAFHNLLCCLCVPQVPDRVCGTP
jgi:hypothetical protein